VIGGTLIRRVGHQRHLIGADLLDQRDELRCRVAFDIIFDGRRELLADKRGELGDIGAPDVALIGTRVHRDAVRAGLDDQTRCSEHARIADIALVAQQRHLVEVDAELGLDRCGHNAPPAPIARA
jgi:hypothetical protein